MLRAVSFTVSVTPELAQFVDEKVDAGGYASRSEVVRAALRALLREEPGPGGREEGRSGSDGRRGGNPECEPGGAAREIARLVEQFPGLREHRDGIVGLAAEVGVDDLEVLLEPLEVSTEDRVILTFGAERDPNRPYPVLSGLADRISELLGTTVQVWEQDSREGPFTFGREPSVLVADIPPAELPAEDGSSREAGPPPDHAAPPDPAGDGGVM